jgi:predicted porin
VHGIDSAYQLSGDPTYPATNPATAPVPGLFRDSVVITRVSAGVDYLVSKRCNVYFRYVMMDYQDGADKAEFASSTLPIDGLPLSGISNMFLGGFSATY